MAKVSTLQISLLLATAALIQTPNSLANFDSNDYYDNFDFDLDDDGGGWWWNWNAEPVTTQATSLETQMKSDSTTTPEIKTSDSTSEMQSTSGSTTPELQRTRVSTTPELQRTSISTTPELQRTRVSTTPELQRTSVTTTPEMQRTSVSTTPGTQRTRVFTTPETQRPSPPSTTLEPHKTSEWPTTLDVDYGSTTELATSDHDDVRGIFGSESAHTTQLGLGVHAVTEGTSGHASGHVITAAVIPPTKLFIFGPEDEDDNGKTTVSGENHENTTLSGTTFTDDILIVSTTTTATTTKDVTLSSTYFPPTSETTSTKSEKVVSTRKTPKKALVTVFQESPATSSNLRLLNRNREDSALQTYLSTCSKCMVRQDPWSVCPLHVEAVTLQTWANQLSDILSHGCSLGSGNKGRCCVNNDATIVQLLREMTRRIRDAYRELQDSCSLCPKDGGWSDWTAWASCSVTCGSGMRIRHRTCNNPPPGVGAENCQGPSRDSTLCFPGLCCEPVDGQWTQWEAWSACSASCGDGTRQRIRTCRNPPPNRCGEKCLGEDVQTDVCRVEECCDPVNGHWSPWTLWSPCSVTCGSGSRERTRTCTNPRPNQCGSACPGSDREQMGCVEESCCLDGNWGDWAPWSTCSVSCGSGGVKERSRRCDSPAPNRCGERCPGPRSETTECNCQPCCVDGSWGAWQPWSSCSKSCDRDGIQTRIRRCDGPPPNFCGIRCPGSASDERPCIPHNPGPVDGNWGSWERWSQVTVSCGVGMRERRRRCDNPRPDACGLPCPGPSMQRERYDTKIPCFPLCVDGSWGSWGSWGACPVTCGMAVRERRRSCDSPRPNHCGRPCAGSSSQKTLQRCGSDPVDGNWGPWGAWGACPVTCGMAMRERRRSCDFPPPNQCGRPCPGPASQATLQRCGPDTVHGKWSPWGAWSTCSVTCGGGRRHRTRTCSSPAPNGCGLRCPGADFDMQRCGTEECEVAEWGTWEAWCPCNCRKGVTSRRRYCLKGGKKVDSLIECQRGGGQAAEEKYCDVRQEKNCPECITDCARKSNGMYPSCSGCSDYIICTNSRATVKRCHANYDWDAHKSECVPRPSESCSLKMPKTSCRGEADGLYHTNGGCHRYAECRSGRKMERRCSNKEQEFDAHLQQCRTGRSRTCVRALAPHLQVVDWRLQQDTPAINTGKVDDATEERTQPEAGVSIEKKLGGKGVGKETKKDDSWQFTDGNDTLRRLRNTVGTTAEKSLDLENRKHLEENRIETSNNVEEVLGEAEHAEKKDDEKQNDEKKIPTLNFDASGTEVEAEVKLQNGNPAHRVSSPNSSGAEAEGKLRNGNLTQRTTGPSPSTATTEVKLQHDNPTQQTQNPRVEMKLDVQNDSRTQQTPSPKAEMELNPNLTHQNPIPNASGVETEIKLRNGDPGLQTQSQSSSGASGPEAEMALRNGDRARHTLNSRALESKAEVRRRTGSSKHLDVLLCRSSCLGLKKGKKYQSCQGCRFFLYCPHKGRGHVKRCHGKRVWDDVRRRCMKRSRTCKENANSIELTEDKMDSQRSVSEPRILTVNVKG